MNRKHFTFFLFAMIFTFVCITLQAQDTPFYLETFPNQQAFTNNWTQGGTNAGPERWIWSNNTTGIFDGQPDFTSTTASDGFIQFNSDANGENNHSVFVTSPAINCSGKNQVFLRCENQYGYFNPGSKVEVGVSTDGTNFTYYEVLTNVLLNNLSAAVQVVILELPEAANQPSVNIRFRWEGNFEYAWRIDDIGLYDADPLPANDLMISEPRVTFNYATPLSQVGEEFFGFIVQNVGGATQNNITAQLTINDANGEVFSTAEVINSLAPMASDTIAFAETFTPNAAGLYTYEYTVTQAETDGFPQDNSYQGEFAITQTTFAKDNGIIASATQPNTVQEDFWEVGNYYLVVNEGAEAFQADFSVASNANLENEIITLFLYRIVDDGNTTFDNDDLEVVGFNTFTYTNEENFDLVSVEILDLQTGEPGVLLTPGEYVLTVQLTPDMFIAYSDIPYYYDLATFVNNGGWFTGGFGEEVTAIIRLLIRDVATSTEEPQLADNQLIVFPNPVQEMLNIKLELTSLSANTQFQIIDAAGRTVWTGNYENVTSQSLNINASQWAAGTYFLNVRTDEGVKTKRFVVQK